MSRLAPVVLIVDDDQDTRELYAWALSREGLTIFTMADAEAALRSITDVHPDVIVTDLSMPGRVADTS